LKKTYKIAISPGDGVGHEIIGWAQKTLEAVAQIDGGFTFQFIPFEVGAGAYKKTGESISPVTLETMKSADATLLVAIAAAEIPRHLPNPIRVMRRELDIFANIRPVKDYPRLAPQGRRIDLIVVRENTEGFYSGIEYKAGPDAACAVRVITRRGSERISRVAFQLARERRKKVTVVHKSPAHRVSDGFFLDVVERVRQNEFPELELEKMLVDAAAAHLIRNPMRFDVILAPNAYGDILSDEASEITGGVGLAPSGNIGEKFALFEPAHGTAPGRAGKGIANPMATLLSAKLMLDYLGQKEAASRVQKAVERVIEEERELTPDLGGKGTTDKVGQAVLRALPDRV
jgi:isopropylmalate/isohomocitrate dehydrogenase-like protein